MINQTEGVTKGTRLFIGQIDLIALGIGKIKWLIIVNYYVLKMVLACMPYLSNAKFN